MRSRLALATSAALLATGLAVPALGADDPAQTTVDGCLASVPEPGSDEPVSICYSIHKPAGATSENPVPMVMHSHGWGGSRSPDAASFSDWLAQGFGILSFDQRGFGESGGLAHVENPDLEGQDVIALVDLIASLDWVLKEPSDTTTTTETRTPGNSGGKGQGNKTGQTSQQEVPVFDVDPVLGAIGGSYGGGYQFVGAFTELRDSGATRFDALAPEITWFDLKESLAPEEVPRATWQAALQAIGFKDEPTELQAGFAYGVATGQWPGTGDLPVSDLDAFFEKNGPKWHVSQGRQLDIPVLLGQGVTDNLFNLNQGLKNFDQALTPAARERSMLVGYNGGHALPNVLPMGYGVSGDPCSVALGSDSFRALSQRFLRANLLGADTGLTGLGDYHLATADGACLSVDSVVANTDVALGQVATPAAVGAGIAYELAAGPLTVAGQPTVDGLLTAAGVQNRAFYALSVGTTPADARVVANNMMPLQSELPVVGEPRSFELPAVAVEVPEGQKLFLTVSAVSDMFASTSSRAPGVQLLEETVVHLPVVGQP